MSRPRQPRVFVSFYGTERGYGYMGVDQRKGFFLVSFWLVDRFVRRVFRFVVPFHVSSVFQWVVMLNGFVSSVLTRGFRNGLLGLQVMFVFGFAPTNVSHVQYAFVPVVMIANGVYCIGLTYGVVFLFVGEGV